MTTLSELIELDEKATEGEYFVGTDDAQDTIPHKNSGLALIDNGTQSDWPVARLCEWPTAQYLAALVNWFRSEGRALAEDGERLRYVEREHGSIETFRKAVDAALHRLRIQEQAAKPIARCPDGAICQRDYEFAQARQLAAARGENRE
jgi:hypothetical protein